MERRETERHLISYYFQVKDATSHEVLGSLVNISKRGLMIDSAKPQPLDKNLRIRMDTTPEIADTLNIEFTARVRWCHQDPTSPGIYDIGLEFVKISAPAIHAIERLAEIYGTPTTSFDS